VECPSSIRNLQSRQKQALAVQKHILDIEEVRVEKHRIKILYLPVDEKGRAAGCQQLMPVTLATWEAEIGRIKV
jgi:ribosome maturation protein Sdo1